MSIALDASSVINLFNADALELVLGIPDHQFLISPMVAGECHTECMAEIVKLMQSCDITLVADEDINAEIYLGLLDEHDLGEGETECLAICSAGGHWIC